MIDLRAVGPAVDHHPDLVRQLRADLVVGQRREEAHDALGHASGRAGQVRVLGRVGRRRRVHAAGDLDELAAGDQPAKHLGVDAVLLGVPDAEHAQSPGEFQGLARCLGGLGHV